MSVNYDFYPAMKNDKGKIEIIGNFIHGSNSDEGSKNPIPMLSRSGSFIEWNNFDWNRLMIDDMDDKWKEFLTDTSLFSETLDDRRSVAYYAPLDYIYAQDGTGLVRMYIPIKDINRFTGDEASDCDIYWELEDTYSAEAIAEMSDEDRKKYGHFAYVNTYSPEYICGLLSQYMDNYTYYVDNKLYVVVTEL